MINLWLFSEFWLKIHYGVVNLWIFLSEILI